MWASITADFEWFFHDNLWNWFCFGCTNVTWNMYHYKAESDRYYTSSLIHFNKKRNISKPKEIRLHCGIEEPIYIFLIECSVSLGNASYYGGKRICKRKFALTSYAKRFYRSSFCCPFHCVMISAGEYHQFHFLTPHLRLSLRPKPTWGSNH